jgi:hypothetical protein
MTTDPTPSQSQRTVAADLRVAHEQRKPIPSVREQLNDIAAGYTLGAPRQSIRMIIHEVPAFHFAVGGEQKALPRMCVSK